MKCVLCERNDAGIDGNKCRTCYRIEYDHEKRKQLARELLLSGMRIEDVWTTAQRFLNESKTILMSDIFERGE